MRDLNHQLKQLCRRNRDGSRATQRDRERNYRHQLRIYEAETTRPGLSKMNGLRHTYAQIRYEELTGWKSPAAGGPQVKTFTEEQEQIDHQARQTIIFELGHVGEQVTVIYLSK